MWKKKTLINFVFAARYYQRFKKQICQPRRELSGNSINVCVGCFWFKGFFFHLFEPISFPLPFSLLYFSYSVTSKPSFFKPLPSSSVYFCTLDGKFMAAKLSLWLPLLQLFLLLGHICFGRCVYGHDTNCFMSHWLSFSTTPFDGLAVIGLYATFILQLILLSSVSIL